MKALVVLEHAGHFRHVATAVARLCARGHQVKLLTQALAPAGVSPAQTHAIVASLTERESCEWDEGLKEVVPRRARTRSLLGSVRGLGRLGAGIPPDPAIRDQVDSEAPDVVIACPFMDRRSRTREYLLAAQSSGIPTAGVVAGPDDLQAASATRSVPDAVFVWNPAMARILRQRHSVAPDRLAVIGAAQFDPYFRYRPERHREAFWVERGVDHRGEIALYFESPAGLADDEPQAVMRLAGVLREQPSTRDVQVVVRPSPGGAGGWERLSVDNVMVWPGEPAFPDTPAQQKELLLALMHSEAAIAVDPIALVEAAISDRPCIRLAAEGGRLDRYRDLDDLASAAFADTADDAGEAARLFSSLVDGQDDKAEDRRRFLAAFVRPQGLGTPAGTVMAQAIESLTYGEITRPWKRAMAPDEEPKSKGKGKRAKQPKAPAPAGDGAPAALFEDDERPDKLRAAGGDSVGLELGDFEQLARMRITHLVEVAEPLVLISQIQRSGGTLLSQLFDGHPQCHAHPHELHIGYPFYKESWPDLDVEADPGTWFEMLRERTSEADFFEGYRKDARDKRLPLYEGESFETHPFLLVPSLQRRIFHHCVAARTVRTPRDILDCYMTSYFNAWLDNHNLAGDKRWVTGFAARLGVAADNRDRFFRDYPDGRLISIIREPRSWFASASRYHAEKFGDVERSMRLWSWSARGMVEAKQLYGDRVFILKFESLVRETEPTMRAIAEFLGIDFTPSLSEPTFNGLPIKANSSFPVLRHGVLAEPVSRQRELPTDAASYIDAQVDGLYEQVAALAG